MLSTSIPRHASAGLALLLATTSALAGCTSPQGSSDVPRTITIGQTSLPSSTDPIKNSWSLTADGVAEYPYMLDPRGQLTSRFFSDATQDDDHDWTLKVRPGARFSDGSAVDAQAIAASLNEIQEKNPLSNSSVGRMVFTPQGETIKVHTPRTTRVLTSVLGEFSNVIYKRDAEGNPVFTGPYVVKKIEKDTALELAPNPHYPEAARRSPVTVKKYADADAMKMAIQSRAIDMAFTVTPAVADQLRTTPGLSVKSIDAGYQYFARPNLSKGALSDAAVRRALDTGLDRQAYVTALKGGRVATGVFASYYSFAGTERLTSDPAAANRMLDEAGWTRGADGVRTRGGQRLEIHLVTYPSRPDLSIIMQVMASQLTELGVAARTSMSASAADAMKSGDYDMVLWAQHTAPTGDPSFFLNQFFRTGGANNLNGYSSPHTDKLLDDLTSTPPGAERDQKAVEAQRQLRTDLPALFLVDPQWHVALSDRLRDYTPYCGDYYVVNPQLGL